MSERKRPPGWERGRHAGVFCTICLHSPRLQPAAHPADLAAADRSCSGGWKRPRSQQFDGNKPAKPHVVPTGCPFPRAAAGCPCRGAQLCNSSLHRPWEQTPLRPPGAGAHPGHPLTFSIRWPGRGRAWRGGGEGRGGGSYQRLGLGRALRVPSAQRHRSYTNRYTLSSARDNTPSNVNTGLWQREMNHWPHPRRGRVGAVGSSLFLWARGWWWRSRMVRGDVAGTGQGCCRRFWGQRRCHGRSRMGSPSFCQPLKHWESHSPAELMETPPKHGLVTVLMVGLDNFEGVFQPE